MDGRNESNEPVGVTGVLRDEHKKIKGLFRQLEAVDRRAPEMRAGVMREILMELEIYSRVEDEYFYPELRPRLPAEAADRLDESARRRSESQALMDEVREFEPGSDDYEAAFGDLIQAFREQIDQEEISLFPEVQKLDGKFLEVLGDRIRKRRHELTETPVYASSRPEITQDPHGGEQKRKRPKAA